jgi:hypothetical protein
MAYQSVMKSGTHVPTFSPDEEPKPIVEDHKDVTLATDLYFVPTILRKIKFRTVTPLKNLTKTVMLKETKTVSD